MLNFVTYLSFSFVILLLLGCSVLSITLLLFNAGKVKEKVIDKMITAYFVTMLIGTPLILFLSMASALFS